MLVVQVLVHVKPEYLDAFMRATQENALNSLQEPGVARFDIIQQLDDPTYFVLIEVYRDDQAPAKHKETAHYLKWRDTVSGMIAEPRTGIRYHNVFPDDSGWG